MYAAMREFIKATVALEVRNALDTKGVVTTVEPIVLPGEKGADGADGEDGVGVKAAAIEEGELVLTLSDGSRLKAGSVVGPRGEKGDAGPPGESIVGPQGPQGEQGPAGPAGAASTVPGPSGEPGKDGKDGKNGIDGKDGDSGARGPRGEQGLDGKDGRDGRDGKDITAKQLGALVEELRAELETKAAEFFASVHFEGRSFKAGDTEIGVAAVPLYRGVWKEGEAYERGDMATWGGSSWHCNAATTEKPGASDDWVLAVKRGRDGK